MANFLSKTILSPYYLTLKLRNHLYDKGIFKSEHFDVPVICIGNITAGGTGKTPMAELVASILSQDMRVGILSRGYRRKSKGFRYVSADDTAQETGDEPLQMKRKFPQAVVAVCKERRKGIREILSLPEDVRPEVIILDDAFQHRRVTPSKSILLINYNRPTFKDELLPIGRLRDIPSQIRRADAVVVTKCPGYLEESDKEKFAKKLKIKKGQKIFFSTIGYEEPLAVFSQVGNNRYIYSKEVLLFTGIAHDKPLTIYLSDRYERIGHISFGDHHDFTKGDIRKITRFARQNPLSLLLTTEKDAQRLRHNRHIPDDVKERLFYLPITTLLLTTEEEREFTHFVKKNS